MKAVQTYHARNSFQRSPHFAPVSISWSRRGIVKAFCNLLRTGSMHFAKQLPHDVPTIHKATKGVRR